MRVDLHLQALVFAMGMPVFRERPGGQVVMFGTTAGSTRQVYACSVLCGAQATKTLSCTAPSFLMRVHTQTQIPVAQEGGRKSVDLPESKQPLMLMRYKNKILGMAAQCTRCKFPLVGADYGKVEEGGKEHDALTCKVCGTGYKLPNGEVVESKGTLLSGLFSKTVATRLPVFATLIKEGKVMMGVAPKEPAA